MSTGLGVHASHSTLKFWDYWRENGAYSHDTPPTINRQNYLQTMKRHEALCTTILMLQWLNFLMGNFYLWFGRKEGTTVCKAVKGFECTGIFSPKLPSIPDEKCLQSQYFHQVSTDSLITKHPDNTCFFLW